MSDVAGEIRWYLDHVKVVIKGATKEALRRAAFAIEAEAKVKVMENGQVDTGFMRDAIYTVDEKGSTYAEAMTSASLNPGTENREMAPEESLSSAPDKALAGVIAGANYSIYQESINSFIYAGAERIAPELGATVEAVYREVVE